MSILVIAVVTGRGGKEFGREADAFAGHWQEKGEDVHVVKLLSDRQPVLRDQVLREIENCPYRFDRLAFFCHGTPKWLKCGFNVWNVSTLSAEIRERCGEEHPITVVLYACSCGRRFWTWPWSLTNHSWLMTPEIPGKAGFAARLMGALADDDMDAQIFAHGTRGHTTRNPYCYMFTTGINGSILYRRPVVKRGGRPGRFGNRALKHGIGLTHLSSAKRMTDEHQIIVLLSLVTVFLIWVVVIHYFGDRG